MDLCGSRMLELVKQVRSDGHATPVKTDDGRGSGWRAWRVVAFVLLGLLAGCTVKYGSLPRTDRLGILTVGVSSPADVLLTMGEPRGRGVARLAVDPVPREIWFYDYVEAEGGRTDVKMLLVFFNQKRYDGYLWFSSARLLEGQ